MWIIAHSARYDREHARRSPTLRVRTLAGNIWKFSSMELFACDIYFTRFLRPILGGFCQKKADIFVNLLAPSNWNRRITFLNLQSIIVVSTFYNWIHIEAVFFFRQSRTKVSVSSVTEFSKFPRSGGVETRAEPREKGRELNYLSANLSPIFAAARDRLFRKPRAHANWDVAWFMADSLFHEWVSVPPFQSFAVSSSRFSRESHFQKLTKQERHARRFFSKNYS